MDKTSIMTQINKKVNITVCFKYLNGQTEEFLMPSIALLGAFMCYTDIKRNGFIMTMKKLPKQRRLGWGHPPPQ